MFYLFVRRFLVFGFGDGGLIWIRTLMATITAAGMAKRLVLNLSKPRPRRVRVRYWSGGPLGMWNVKATMYKGLEMRKSQLVMDLVLCASYHSPQVIIFQSFPHHLDRDAFSIVHS